jgi:hypothetical protein
MEIKVLEHKHRPSLIERIKNSTDTLKVSVREISQAMIDYYQSQNVDEMQKLIDVYSNCELINKPAGTSFEHAEENALRNLDTASRIADGFLLEKSPLATGFYAKSTRGKNAGPVTDFVRSLTGYDPEIKRDYLKKI